MSGRCVFLLPRRDPVHTRIALRFNFTLNPPDLLAEGIRRLATAVKALS